jgi:hypothetical protein
VRRSSPEHSRDQKKDWTTGAQIARRAVIPEQRFIVANTEAFRVVDDAAAGGYYRARPYFITQTHAGTEIVIVA